MVLILIARAMATIMVMVTDMVMDTVMDITMKEQNLVQKQKNLSLKNNCYSNL